MPSTFHVPRVVKRNRRRSSDGDHRLAHHGYFYSWKVQALLPYKGTLAFDFLISCEANPDVISIAPGGAPIVWHDGRAWQEYFPRYSVTLRAGAEGASRTAAVEVVSTMEKSRRQAEFDRLKVEARRARRYFEVFTEKRVRVEPRLSNCKLILQQAGRDLAPIEDVNLVRQVAYGTATFSLNDLVRIGVLPYARAYCAALNLVATGELSIELSRPIDGDSRIGRGACHE